MHITDPIADMLTRIRNANSARHDTVDVPASNMKKSIAQILLDEEKHNKNEPVLSIKNAITRQPVDKLNPQRFK